MIHNKSAKYLLHAVLLATGCALYAVETFHFKNNSNESIQVALLQGNASKPLSNQVITIGKKSNDGFNIDINKPSTLYMYVCDNKCGTQEPDTLIAEFTASDIKTGKLLTGKPLTGKTLHLKWDGKSLKAQKGNKLTKAFRTANVEDNEISKVSRYPGRKLTTGTAASITQEIESKKGKPAIATAKPTKGIQSSTVKIGAGRTPQPKEVLKTKAELAQEAWEQFPKANTLHKKNDRDYDALMYLAIFDLKDEGSFQEMKQKIRAKYQKIFSQWDPNAKGLSLNEQLLAGEVRKILNEAEKYLQDNYDAQEAKFNETAGVKK